LGRDPGADTSAMAVDKSGSTGRNDEY
jgi:hypothetical protein